MTTFEIETVEIVDGILIEEYPPGIFRASAGAFSVASGDKTDALRRLRLVLDAERQIEQFNF